MISIPVLLLVFNRPHETKIVLEALRKAKVNKLYVACDGPRVDNSEDILQVNKVKELIQEIDWNCKVTKLYRSKNLGCGKAVQSAIDWFFVNEPEGIIIEDDCVPSLSFFDYCEKLLEKYRYDDRIFMLSGHNTQGEWKSEKNDYFFSNFGGIWGWASWRNRWLKHTGNMDELDDMIKEGQFQDMLGNRLAKRRIKILTGAKRRLATGELDTWDYQWAYTRHKFGGLSCVPSINLIQNIGFGDGATHTRNIKYKIIQARNFSKEIKTNSDISADLDYDNLFLPENKLVNRILRKLGRSS